MILNYVNLLFYKFDCLYFGLSACSAIVRMDGLPRTHPMVKKYLAKIALNYASRLTHISHASRPRLVRWEPAVFPV